MAATTKSISLTQARRLALASQGLNRARPFGGKSDAVAAAIEQLGYVQIDTISVVQRAHHHVLHSRIPTYGPSDLDEAFQERTIFEYWHHAASFLPMQHFRFALPRMRSYQRSKQSHRFVEPAMLRKVKERIRTDGPLRARDFETPTRKNTGWWDWKPAKKALEMLFHQGSLMVTRRDGFQKVYDLTERVLPSDVDTSMPSPGELADHLIDTALTAHGIVRANDIGRLRARSVKDKIKSRLLEREEDGELVRVRVNEHDAFVFADQLDRTVRKPDTHLRVLSPFDNMVIFRDRLKWLFDYDYQIECYVPGPKRKYGYFCLPLLLNEKFVGRIDAKAERDLGRLVVKRLIWEGANTGVPKALLERALERFAEFNGCGEFVVENVKGLKRPTGQA